MWPVHVGVIACTNNGNHTLLLSMPCNALQGSHTQGCCLVSTQQSVVHSRPVSWTALVQCWQCYVFVMHCLVTGLPNQMWVAVARHVCCVQGGPFSFLCRVIICEENEKERQAESEIRLGYSNRVCVATGIRNMYVCHLIDTCTYAGGLRAVSDKGTPWSLCLFWGRDHLVLLHRHQ